MKKLIYILPLFTASILVNCGANESEADQTSKETAQEKSAPGETEVQNLYNLDPTTAVVKWTAFKLAEKVGVEGEFKSYSMTGYHENATSVSEMMTGTEISLDVTSTKTGDEARDGKIINSFFGSMINTPSITARLVSMDGETQGKAQVEITMNETSFTQEMEWIFREDLSTFILQGVVNIPDWNAQSALDALTIVCEEKHKGTGDKAVTWPDVEVKANVKVIVAPAEGV
ncbi:MAG: YceI family protein [Flavobacteriales bacterium]|nr:YceI family protein [Flavobacteriales bacterium]